MGGVVLETVGVLVTKKDLELVIILVVDLAIIAGRLIIWVKKKLKK